MRPVREEGLSPDIAVRLSHLEDRLQRIDDSLGRLNALLAKIEGRLADLGQVQDQQLGGLDAALRQGVTEEVLGLREEFHRQDAAWVTLESALHRLENAQSRQIDAMGQRLDQFGHQARLIAVAAGLVVVGMLILLLLK